MGGLSWWHWLIIGGAFILLFGAKKLPEAARGVGRSLRILKSEVSAMHDDEQSAATVGAPTATAAGITPAPDAAAPIPPVATTPASAPARSS